MYTLPIAYKPSPLRGFITPTLMLLASLSLASCAIGPRPLSTSQDSFSYVAPVQQPEGASGYTEKSGWATKTYAVAAANPLATDAGKQILQAGGSAVDAAIAVQMVLGLVEPQSSGIAGGAFLVHADARPSNAGGLGLQAYDGRETAPAAVDEKLFIGADGKPMAFIDAVVGGRSVGTSGVIKMLEMAHAQHGKLPWSTLFKPAIALAETGFRVSPRLNTLLGTEKNLIKDKLAASYFYDADGKPLATGTLLKNPEYADILKNIAANGSKAFYTGELAEAIVKKVQSHETNPGKLSTSDLANYQAKVRQAFCFDQSAAQKIYTICGMPPPSSGPIAIAQILGILAQTPAANQALAQGLPSADWLHYYTEASRLAFADRGQYLADPDFVQAPAGSWQSLNNPAYLAERAKLIGEKSMKTAKPGVPAGAKLAYAAQPDQIEYGTSHISIIDQNGNALAMTTTIEDAFGARQMVNRGKGFAGGFLLNNQLTDFSFAPTDAEGKPIANRVEPLKRPRSSMSPVLVFDKDSGQVVASTGSPGGALIIHYTAKTLYGMLNWGLNAQQAINLPNFGSLNGPTVLEDKRFPAATVEALKARDHVVNEINMTSGLQAIQKTATGYFGGADPRREGVVLGD